MAPTKERSEGGRQAPPETPVPREESPQESSAGGQAPARAFAPSRRIDQLAERGFGVADDFVDAELLAELRARCLELDVSGGLRAAKIGRGTNERLAPEVRGDFISWLEAPERDAEQRLLAKLDELRAA